MYNTLPEQCVSSHAIEGITFTSYKLVNNMPDRPKSLFLLSQDSLNKIYSTHSQARIAELTQLEPTVLHYETWQNATEQLKDIEYIFSGWGMAHMDDAFLDAVPNLKYIFYGSGTIRSFYSEAAQERGIRISSAWRANAVPTAEYAHALIILGLKKFFRATRTTQANRNWQLPADAAGIYKSTVGIVSLGTVGQLVAKHLRDQHNLNVIAYDPFASNQTASELGLKLVSLEELFKTADVVSLHAPDLPATEEMITEQLLRSMKANATLINTARGGLINEASFAQVFEERCDLDAVIDVTQNEPHNAECPLWKLSNVVISPHIAGSLNQECQRMGEYMVEELERHLAGQPMQHEVTPEVFLTMA